VSSSSLFYLTLLLGSCHDGEVWFDGLLSSIIKIECKLFSCSCKFVLMLVYFLNFKVVLNCVCVCVCVTGLCLCAAALWPPRSISELETGGESLLDLDGEWDPAARVPAVARFTPYISTRCWFIGSQEEMTATPFPPSEEIEYWLYALYGGNSPPPPKKLALEDPIITNDMQEWR